MKRGSSQEVEEDEVDVKVVQLFIDCNDHAKDFDTFEDMCVAKSISAISQDETTNEMTDVSFLRFDTSASQAQQQQAQSGKWDFQIIDTNDKLGLPISQMSTKGYFALPLNDCTVMEFDKSVINQTYMKMIKNQLSTHLGTNVLPIHVENADDLKCEVEELGTEGYNAPHNILRAVFVSMQFASKYDMNILLKLNCSTFEDFVKAVCHCCIAWFVDNVKHVPGLRITCGFRSYIVICLCEVFGGAHRLQCPLTQAAVKVEEQHEILHEAFQVMFGSGQVITSRDMCSDGFVGLLLAASSWVLQVRCTASGIAAMNATHARINLIYDAVNNAAFDFDSHPRTTSRPTLTVHIQRMSIRIIDGNSFGRSNILIDNFHSEFDFKEWWACAYADDVADVLNCHRNDCFVKKDPSTTTEEEEEEEDEEEEDTKECGYDVYARRDLLIGQQVDIAVSRYQRATAIVKNEHYWSTQVGDYVTTPAGIACYHFLVDEESRASDYRLHHEWNVYLHDVLGHRQLPDDYPAAWSSQLFFDKFDEQVQKLSTASRSHGWVIRR